MVQLSTMAVRAVLAPLDDWCLALAATNGSDQRTRLVCLDGAGVIRAWMLTASSTSGTVDVASSAPVSAQLPLLPLPITEEEAARRKAKKVKALAEAEAAAPPRLRSRRGRCAERRG